MKRDRLGSALAETARDHGPGVFALVTDDDEVVFESCVGVADLSSRRPIDASDRFRIGSVTKTYSTALVLRLVADGLLALDDTVERWLPGLVPDADEITIRLLLQMRSGLPDYVEPLLGDPPDLSALQRYWPPHDLVLTALTSPGRMKPDTAYRYSNTDYVLLGMIVETATGQPVEAQLWQKIFEPLSLDDTTFPTVDPQIRGPHANGHLRQNGDQTYLEFTTLSPSQSWTAGGIISTPRDVARFFDALFGGRVIDDERLALMTECSEQLDERSARGLGVVRYAYPNGKILFGHHGGIPGFTTLVLRSTTGRTIVLYQNGVDTHNILTSDTPFIDAAVAL